MRNAPAAPHLRGAARRGIALGVIVALLTGGAAALPAAATPAAATPALDAEWAQLSAKFSGIYGEWTTETYENAINSTMPNTALLGNGDVGVSSAGSSGVKTFIVSKGDFWNGAGGVRSAGLGGYTIKSVETVQGPSNLALNKPVAASSDPESRASRAVNGQWSAGSGYEGWFSSVGKPQWFRVDLQASTTIARVVLRHDSSARPAETANNPKIFTIQYSNAATAPGTAIDASGWTTLQSYTTNTAGSTDLSFPPVTARWVRVIYAQPTQESTGDSTQNPRARLGQFEVYAPAAGTDYALGATATASTSHPSFPPSRAVNGQWATGINYEGWVSDVGQPQWIALDLGATRTFDRYVIKNDGAARPAENANNTRDWQFQTSTNGTDWVTADTVAGNTAASVERVLSAAVTTRYVRLLVTQGVQSSTEANPRARIGQFQLFNGPVVTTPPPVTPAFRERQNIVDATIDTDMSLGGSPVHMHTWQGQDENVVVTRVTLDAAATGPETLELSTWAGAGAANGSYTNTSGVSGQTLWATRQTSTSGTPLWVSRAALATRVIGATLQSPSSSGATAKGTFTLQPGQTVYITTGVGGGGQNPTDHLTTAQALAAAQTTQSLAELAAGSAQWWKDYWLQSWVDLGDPLLEKYYYGAQYLIGSASRPGHLAPGLYGIWYTQDNPSFSGDMHLNYNFQSPWYGVYSSNRAELSLPMYDLIEDFVPAAQARASTYSELRKVRPAYVDARPELAAGADGVLFPVGIGPWGSTTDNQYWQQTSNGLFNAVMYIQYW
ncbi:MAG TPA: discoidin domain-containing protein, partial [Nocardioidaceae bacterium]|nr:discoidin domain-containing protein [Nocardioidaceae bacterium]